MIVAKTTMLSVAFLGLMIAGASEASATPCVIGFSDRTGLKRMPDQAIGFAEAPWYTNVCGGIAVPVQFLVDENGGTIENHFHVGPDDPTINCFTTNATYPNGVMGRTVNGSCVAVDPLATSRFVTFHHATQFVRVSTGPSIRWRATGITVKGTQPLRVLVEQADGTFWQFTNLTPGAWNLGNTGKLAKQIWIMNQDSSSGTPGSFDDVRLDHSI